MIYRLAAIATTATLLTAPVQAQELSIVTGGTGGVYFPIGGGLAEIINRHIEGATASAEVTGASVENIALISRGDSDMGLTQGDTVYQAFHGEGAFEGRQIPEMRILAAIYPSAMQLVTLADSGIESINDLAGERVAVGPPGSGTELLTRVILDANGITFDDFSPQRLNLNEAGDALRDGDIVAAFMLAGPPTPAIMNLAFTRSIRMIPFSEEQIEAAVSIEPTLAPYTLRAGLYEGVDESVLTISQPNVLITHADMDEDMAFNIVKALFENLDELIAVHPAAIDTTIEFTMDAAPIPFHAGAARYFEGLGIELRDHQQP